MNTPLNIPFSRTHQTTRRPRRVVWAQGAGVILFLLIFSHLTTLWLTRNTVFDAAPQNTAYAVQLSVNPKTVPLFQELIGKIPLISERPLTIANLLPFTRGELAWFFQEDGTRSVAIRAKKEDLPMALLDSAHIVVQEIHPTIFLLSQKLQAGGGIPKKRALRDLFPTVMGQKIGMFYEKGAKSSSSITQQGRKIHFRLSSLTTSGTKPLPIKAVPNGAYLILSTPVLTNAQDAKQIAGLFSATIDPLMGRSFAQVMDLLLSHNGSLFVMKNETNGPEFLLESGAVLEQQERLRLIRSLAAIQAPIEKPLKLQDGTVIREFIADPDGIPVEERTINGRTFYHAATEKTSFFITKNDYIQMASSEMAIQKEKKLMACDTNIALISLKDLFQTQNVSNRSYSSAIFYQFSDAFTYIGLKQRGKSIFLNLCF